MLERPVVAGVDDSAEAIAAAQLACEIADRGGVDCYLVHAAREFWAASGGTDIPIDVGTMNQAVLHTARERLTEVLSPRLPKEALDRLEVMLGRPAVLLREVVVEKEAGLVVLGAKHHPALTRWMGGSTVHNVVRTSRVPVLVSRMDRTAVRRVLVAVDISYATGPTVAEAIRLTRLFDATLRVAHVVEPVPLIATLPIVLDQDAYFRMSETQFNAILAEHLTEIEAQKVMRHGESCETLIDEVDQWDADLLVIGSHGKGWVDRLLVGSTTERLLNQLPTSILVVPVADSHGSS